MSIVVLGLNHKSAAVGIRERLAFDASEATTALRRLREMEPGAEFVLLSTCNRVELYYAGTQDWQEAAGRRGDFLSSSHGLEVERFKPALYSYRDEEAVRHLLLVAAGLDSMVVGEAQILGQVKDSYKSACAAKSTGKILNRLFHCAFFTAKNVHTRTAISNGRVSVAGVAIELAQQLFADIARAKVVVIGAGQTGEMVVQHLVKAGCRVPLEEMVDRVVNKLLHCAIKNVTIVAKEAGPTEAAKLVDTILKQAREISCQADREDMRA